MMESKYNQDLVICILGLCSILCNKFSAHTQSRKGVFGCISNEHPLERTLPDDGSMSVPKDL